MARLLNGDDGGVDDEDDARPQPETTNDDIIKMNQQMNRFISP